MISSKSVFFKGTDADRSLADNPLISRRDLRKSLLDLLKPLESRYVAGGIHTGHTGASYSPRTAELEAWSRILWGLAPLSAGGGEYPLAACHVAALRRGTDNACSSYWGEAINSDQRLVEMAAIALSLMISPNLLWDPLDAEEKDRLYRWLAVIEKRTLPENNWHFFRVLVCAAFRSLGLPVDEAAERESFDLIESLYRGDGWYEDGPGGNFDLYNPMGFHFYGLVYARLMGERYPERAAVYRERARLFASQYLAYFRQDGSMVPHGRSLTYRFAAVSFFSACAFAEEEIVPWGTLKGLILRNLRWWFQRPILDNGGVLSIGYGYPNLIMAEQYNSPASPYWALKAYLPLALGEDHPFWTSAEESLPPQPAVRNLPVPGYLLSRSEEDVQLLCPGRYPPWEAVQAAAKYGKFAYSARFGFCVSHGSYGLEKSGCDSSLVLSEGDGYWRERRRSSGFKSGANWVSSRWKPWDDVEIETLLIALGAWHLRVHSISSGRALDAVEGGFSIPRFPDSERFLGASAVRAAEEILSEGDALGRRASASAVSFQDASRIVCLDPIAEEAVRFGASTIPDSRRPGVLTPEPNLNILEPSVLIPVLRGPIPPGRWIFACAVRGGDREPTLAETPPEVEFTPAGLVVARNSGGLKVAEVKFAEDWG